MSSPNQSQTIKSGIPAQTADAGTVAPVARVALKGVSLLRVEPLRVEPWMAGAAADWLWHGFSTRRGGVSRAYREPEAEGDLNLGFTAEDESERVARNRCLLVEAVTGNPHTPLITLRQVHSSAVVLADGQDFSRATPHQADGLMTAEPGLLIGVQTADCIPVLVADRRRRVVAAFHAGWRGTVKRIVETGVARMRREFGCRPEDLTAAIGPGIGACCYVVGNEVLSSFKSNFTYGMELFHEASDPAGPVSLLSVDLVEANRRQLLDAGLAPDTIHATGGCTSCHADLFFSHRASGGRTGRMMSVIGIRSRE
jgi:YfiH family protein